MNSAESFQCFLLFSDSFPLPRRAEGPSSCATERISSWPPVVPFPEPNHGTGGNAARPHMATPFWISHHGEDELSRCVRIGRFDVCARCLGLYPPLLVLLAVEAIVKAPGFTRADAIAIPLATLPALLDWARGRFAPKSGSNAVRLATGALLSLALARSLWLHFATPLHPVTLAHLSWIAASATMVEFAASIARKASYARQPPEEMGPMPLTTEEILAGMSMDDVQERYGLPKSSEAKTQGAGEDGPSRVESNASQADGTGLPPHSGERGTPSMNQKRP